jgi:chromate transporter
MIGQFELFWIMLKAALLSTSGTGNLPIVHQDLLSRGWATEHQFAESLAIGQLSPGPTGLWAISLGYLLGGWRAAAVTLVAVALPPLVVLLLVHGIYRRYGHHPATQGFVRGLSLAVVGVYIIIMSGIMKNAGWTPSNFMIAAGAVVLGSTRRLPGVVILIVAAIIGIALYRMTG